MNNTPYTAENLVDAWDRPESVTLDLPGIREFVQEHPGCDWENACDWFEQVSGVIVPRHQWSIIEEAHREASELWEPTDDDMMASFGTPWHDGL